jgi:hypothetical protein
MVEEVEAAIVANLTCAGKPAPQSPDDEPASVLSERIRGEREKQGVQQKLPGV